MSQDFTFTSAHQKGCFLDIVDEDWLKDELPNDDIMIPLPDPFTSEDSEEKKPEKSWADIEFQTSITCNGSMSHGSPQLKPAMSSVHYFDQYFKTNNALLKLANLKLLKQARDLKLISDEQYKEKQLEFLRGIDFALETDLESLEEQVMGNDMTRSIEYYSDHTSKRRRFSPPRQGNELALTTVPEGGIKYRTFSEFIYGALIKLGGTASLSTLYEYVFTHQLEIDPKFKYRFEDKGYKSNVRSTLHNTGSFRQLPDGTHWTIACPLKGRR